MLDLPKLKVRTYSKKADRDCIVVHIKSKKERWVRIIGLLILNVLKVNYLCELIVHHANDDRLFDRSGL
jgi:hypothetical protein